MSRQTSAPGKIILTGEYAVVFGYPGIAVPAPLTTEVTYDDEGDELSINSDGTDNHAYIERIVNECEKIVEKPIHGSLKVKSNIPIGKGMGSSTALVIAVARALLGDDCGEHAHAIEETLNPEHSGIDFNVIWNNQAMWFIKDKEINPVELPADLLDGAVLIDTGAPNEKTPELVAWVKEREGELQPHLEVIGKCSEYLIQGEDLATIIRTHNRAQISLGVVPEAVQDVIAEIEGAGGAAKVLGAGGKTGGGGMVLGFGVDRGKISLPVRPL